MSTPTIPNTWQEAFDSQSIANIRAFEKQLRAGALRDKEKLRVIVGSNYRDLLSTAEQIATLNTDARDAEASISSLSQACKPPDLQAQLNTVPARTELIYQLKLLDRLLRCASRSVKQHAVLLASKMLIIARPLLKYIEDKHGATSVTQWFAARLKSVRSQLTNRVNNILLKPSSSLNDLIQASAAFCLLTSSSSTDAVKHFQNIRLHRLALVEDSSRNTNDLKQSCHYLITSAASIKALSGRSLVDLLNDLQKRPILASDDIQGLETLQLDTDEDLLPQDILTFVPYFKRNTPSKTELQTNLEQWVSEAAKHIIHRIRGVLTNAGLRKALKVRQEVLEILLPNFFSSALYGEPIDSIRDVFSKAITLRIEQLAEEIEILGTQLAGVAKTSSSQSLWTSNVITSSGKTPTSTYLRKAQHQHLGATSELHQYVRKLSQWCRKVQAGQVGVQALSKAKWHDKLEDYDDEHEDMAHEVISALTKEDAQNFATKFEESLLQKCNEMVDKLGEQATQIARSSDSQEQSEPITHATTMLRALREIRALLKSLLPTTDFSALTEATSRLIGCLAQQVASELFKSRENERSPRVISPYIPEDLPSPLTVSVLQELCTIMLVRGGHDLWSTEAVRQLGSVLSKHIMSEENRKFYIASDFDEQYLRIALGTEPAEGVDVKSDVVYRRATTYWSRTKTLFGILNV